MSAAKAPTFTDDIIDVTAVAGGPFLGKIYDRAKKTWSDPPPPPPETPGA